MHLLMILLTTLLSLTIAAPLQEPVLFLLKNNCPFPLYIREAVAASPSPRPWERCKNSGETPEAKMPAHSTAYGGYPVLKDSCGHSIKVSRHPRGAPYQFEFTWALENDRMWYDMSHEDGNPFTDVEREFAPHNHCPALKCGAGNDGSACDYAIQTDCATKGKLHAWLCGRGKGEAEARDLSGAVAIGKLEVVEGEEEE
ncbi:hypothetical protein DE146DRAFT_655330 [Phaeosphaeria sp. MPI-PUGE-AT-0046c]|nr:hypothetical protein DE146DRAFT_655330 [Phaeosphaeria sp. MPI-PUGE-AT-0046c]